MSSRSLIVVVALVLSIAGLASVSARAPKGQPSPADLVLTNGRVVTVEDGQPDAQALAIGGDRIVAVGSSADIRRYVGPATRVIDVGGQLVIPGFVEGHGHFTGLGEAQLNLNLMNVKSWDEIVAMVAEAVKTAKPGQWIRGRGWHQEKWSAAPSPNVEGFPTHASLDRVSPDNPVVLTHASGHASFVNAKAMAVSGLTRTNAKPGRWRSAEGRERRPDRAAARDGGAADTGAGADAEERVAYARKVLRARGSRSPVEGDHQLPGRGRVVRHDRPDEDDGGRRRHGRPPVGDGAGEQRDGGAEARPLPDDRLRRRPPDRPRHQASDRRCARVARRLAARALLGQAREHRPQHDVGRVHPRDREARDRERLPALRARDRRSCQPRDAEHLRGGVQGEPRQEGSSLAHRARAAPQPVGHPAVRPARRDCVDAGRALHVGRPLRARRGSAAVGPKRAPTSGRS